jgi:hypothetical protein
VSIAIMQPYAFPYIGYFQLIYASDLFVFYDDVNYINRGWINRNRILVNDKDSLVTIPVKNASQNVLIKDVGLFDNAKAAQKILATIKNSYKKAPHFNITYQLIESIFGSKSETISEFAINSITIITSFLNLDTDFKISSQSYQNQYLKKADRLIDICRIENQKEYINAEGGKTLYNKENFRSKGINLQFLVSNIYEYQQFGEKFVPGLSIIDVLMFNSAEEIKRNILPAFYLE